MDKYRLNDMTKGWFVGDFAPTAYRTSAFEVSYRIHPRGEVWETHYHRQATEINLLISGKMILQGQTLESNDIFILHPFEIADPEFLTDCAIICVKVPSVQNDKFTVGGSR